MPNTDFTWVECPRDAMQGWPHPIATADKVRYLNSLLKVGFGVLDGGSFVSPKAIPQMADTKDVIPQLELERSGTKLLTIIANTRGAQEAVAYDEVSFLGFPFSISETFQLRNANKTIDASLHEVEEIQRLCVQRGKELVVYISMGFGNPYGDPYSPEVAARWTERLAGMGIGVIALSDTVGVAQPDVITKLFSDLVPAFPQVQIGAHFHSTAGSWREKMDAAWAAGCRRYDSALKGIGGCPMAKDDLVGNMATENILSWTEENNISTPINKAAFGESMRIAGEVFL